MQDDRRRRAQQLIAPVHVYRGRIEVAADNDRRLVADRAQEIIHLPAAPLGIPSPLQVRDTHRDAAAVDLDTGEHGLMRTDQRVSIKFKRRFGQRDGVKVLERLRTQNRVADSAKLAVSSDTTERWHKHEAHLERRGKPGREFDPSMLGHPPARLAHQQRTRIGQRWTRKTGEDGMEVGAAGYV